MELNMSNNEITRKTINDDTVIIETGKILDNNNAHEMVAMINELQEKDFKYIVIDMKNLEFISSAGVGSILGTVEISRTAGGDIILCNLSRTVVHVFDVLDLVEFLTIKESFQAVSSICGVELS